MKRLAIAVSLLAALASGCAQLSAGAGGSTPQTFSYPSNGLNGVF